MGDANETEKLPTSNWVDFLATVPPGQVHLVQGAIVVHKRGDYSWARVNVPFECPICDGKRTFMLLSKAEESFDGSLSIDRVLQFGCLNCGETDKRIAVHLEIRNNPRSARPDVVATKLGELPAFGPSVPSRVSSFVGPDRETFLKGRRSENLGLGIGAFAYYRRVVENQKGRILKQIAEVAKRTGAKPDVVALIEAASNETQFSSAVGMVKAGFPSALLIDGHNPLTLLHTALSQGLHASTDEECLEVAHDVRVVLFDLAERVSTVLADHAELNQSVSRLLNPKKGNQGGGQPRTAGVAPP